jgi:hypothetical protein
MIQMERLSDLNLYAEPADAGPLQTHTGKSSARISLDPLHNSISQPTSRYLQDASHSQGTGAAEVHSKDFSGSPA